MESMGPVMAPVPGTRLPAALRCRSARRRGFSRVAEAFAVPHAVLMGGALRETHHHRKLQFAIDGYRFAPPILRAARRVSVIGNEI